MNTSLLCSASCSLDEARPKGLAHRTGMGGCWRLRTMVLWHSADCPLRYQPSQELCIFCPNVWLKNRTVPSLWPSFLSPFKFYSFISSPSRLSVLFFSASPFFSSSRNLIKSQGWKGHWILTNSTTHLRFNSFLHSPHQVVVQFQFIFIQTWGLTIHSLPPRNQLLSSLKCVSSLPPPRPDVAIGTCSVRTCRGVEMWSPPPSLTSGLQSFSFNAYIWASAICFRCCANSLQCILS